MIDLNSRGMGVSISHRTVPRTHDGSQLRRHSRGKGTSSIFTLCSFAAKLRSRYSEQYWRGSVHVFSLVKASLKVGIRILHCFRSLAPTLSLPRHRMPTASNRKHRIHARSCSSMSIRSRVRSIESTYTDSGARAGQTRSIHPQYEQLWIAGVFETPPSRHRVYRSVLFCGDNATLDNLQLESIFQ